LQVRQRINLLREECSHQTEILTTPLSVFTQCCHITQPTTQTYRPATSQSNVQNHTQFDDLYSIPKPTNQRERRCVSGVNLLDRFAETIQPDPQSSKAALKRNADVSHSEINDVNKKRRYQTSHIGSTSKSVSNSDSSPLQTGANTSSSNHVRTKHRNITTDAAYFATMPINLPENNNHDNLEEDSESDDDSEHTDHTDSESSSDEDVVEDEDNQFLQGKYI
jgi:hypothetical protein